MSLQSKEKELYTFDPSIELGLRTVIKRRLATRSKKTIEEKK